VAEAVVQRLITERGLRKACEEAVGHRGVKRLRAILDGGGAKLTSSEAERRFLALVRAAGLPTPEVNVRMAGFEVDFLWREHRLAVEIDGYAFHGDRTAFERDREKDADLQAAGYRVARFTWRQMAARPAAVAARLGALLAARP